MLRLPNLMYLAHSQVLPDESDWQMENGNLIINLQKALEGWWDRIFCNSDPIDISRFDALPNMLGEMEEHQYASCPLISASRHHHKKLTMYLPISARRRINMRDHMARMLDTEAVPI